MMPLIVMVPPAVATLLLVTVMNLSGLVVPCITLPNASDAGISVGAESVPVPFNVTVAGLFFALLVIVSPPVSAPDTVGSKVRVTVQLLFAANTPLHPSVTIAKSPDTVKPLMVSPTEFGLVNVAVLVGLVPPTTVLAKTWDAGRLIDACRPVPLRLTVCGLLGEAEGIVALPV